MEFTEKDIKKRIIIKLVRWRKWGGSHTENILNGLPNHIRGEKIVRNAIRELIQSGWIISAKKTGELHYSLNSEKIEEILRFYEENCKEK